jgi:4-methoxybenzoate monooxygenase (O-demethylating)
VNISPEPTYPEAVTLDVDPYDPGVLADPYPFYERIRNAGPVVYLPRYKTYALARHAEIQTALQKWQNFTSAYGVGIGDIRKGELWRSPSMIVEVDPPEHTRVRTAMNKIISPSVVRGWRESFESEAERTLSKVLLRGTFDGVRDVAEAFVLKVFPDALGVKVSRDMVVAISDYNFNSVGPQNDLFHRSKLKADPFLDEFQRAFQREAMIPGGFGEKVFAAEDAGDIAEGVAGSVIRSLLRGGMDTTISAIGSALLLLAKHPDQWARLRGEPNLATAVFEETIRIESPIQCFYRTTKLPVEFSGVWLQPDVKVQIMLGSGNRDPRKWERPEEFDIGRSKLGHVSFGAGVHVCIGQMIARLEAESVFKVFARQAATLELAGDARHRVINTLRTLDVCPLEVTLN